MTEREAEHADQSTANFFSLPEAIRPRSLRRHTVKSVGAAVEQASVSMVIMDRNLVITAINERARPFYAPKDVVGMAYRDLASARWLPDTANETFDIVSEVMTTGVPFSSLGFSRVRRDGRVKESYHWDVHRVTGADGEHFLACYFVRLRD